MRKAADDDGGQRNAGDEQQIKQQPTDVFAVDELRARSNLDIRKPAQSEHAKAQEIGQEFRPEVANAVQQLSAVPGLEIRRQADVENQQRHGDTENPVAEGIEPRLGEHAGAWASKGFRLPSRPAEGAAGISVANNAPGVDENF